VLLALRPRSASRRAGFALAAVVEFIHTATLLHDDVVDESRLRPRHAHANAAFGNARRGAGGRLPLFARFQMMGRGRRMRVMRVLADATNTIAAGRSDAADGHHDPEVDEARYLE